MQLYDSRRGHVCTFAPLSPPTISLYTCGITPNNATHLGHAFTYVSVDVLVRHLTHLGYSVDYLQNATDINDSDDVIKQAKEKNMSWQQLAEQWIKHFHVQMDALGVCRPNAYVLATEAIPTIITIVQKLQQEGFAYEVNGSVFFDTSKIDSYGAMCRMDHKQMIDISRERGADPDDMRKKNPLDFLLWVAVESEPWWESPWGWGRPGWHIECSAMIHDRFGEQIDIHAGGSDLIYPHHESEIAQSEAYTTTSPFANHWMHVAMLRYEDEKMSKSLGNLVLVEDLLKSYDANAIRHMLLSHHYRESWEYTSKDIQNAQESWNTLQTKLQSSENVGSFEAVVELLSNDLQTHKVLALCSDMSGDPLRQTLIHLGFQNLAGTTPR